MANASFSHCHASDNGTPYDLERGRAITSFLSHLIFQSETTFTQNDAKYGGSIYAVESSISLIPLQGTNCNIWIADSSATIDGGGMYLYRSIFRIRTCTCQVEGNRANGEGGGIHLLHSDIILDDLRASLALIGNSALQGGGLYLDGWSRIRITEGPLKLVQNLADYGAAIYIDDYTNSDTCHATPEKAMAK